MLAEPLAVVSLARRATIDVVPAAIAVTRPDGETAAIVDDCELHSTLVVCAADTFVES